LNIEKQKNLKGKTMDKKELINFANIELFEKGNFEIISEIFATNYVVHSANKNYEGHDFIKKWFKQIHKTFSNIRVVKVEFFTEENNSIVWQRTIKGKHINKIRGINPSGKNIKWNEIVVSRFDQNKIIEEWVVSELKGELLSKP
jgi:predicted ester cyclase